MFVGGRIVVDTSRASYVWEHPYYPRYYVPVDDLDASLLVDEEATATTPLGAGRLFGLTIDGRRWRDCVAIFDNGAPAGLARIDPDFGDAAWFEEDEQIFVHPRNPYARVDAIRSSRHVRVELDGIVLAESRSPVIIFETGLPPRYYLPRLDVRVANLVASETVTSCPYKGTTSEYWSAPRASGEVAEDIAWAYQFPTREAQPIAGMVCFYDEKVNVIVDGRPTR